MPQAQLLNSDAVIDYNFELFFELSADLLCIAGFDGFFKRINPAVSKLLGYTNDELLSRPINDFVYIEDRAVTSKVRGELTRGKPLINFENRYVTKNGELVWLAWTSMNIDRDQLVFAIAKNITYRKRLEEERNALLLNMTKVNTDLRKLTFTTAHDLRSPINNLLSIFSLLNVSKIEDQETLGYINILKSASENLKQTLSDYVDVLVQKESANQQIEELDFNEVLNGVLRSIRSLIEDSGVTINADFSQLKTVNFNKTYLQSIFLNLLTNSIKYAKPGCLPVISIQTSPINGIKQLIFSDNCLGFDMDKVKDKIFGFHQKFHHHNDSKGIGLYLIYNHITSMGGRISVESKLNEGATFTITF